MKEYSDPHWILAKKASFLLQNKEFVSDNDMRKLFKETKFMKFSQVLNEENYFGVEFFKNKKESIQVRINYNGMKKTLSLSEFNSLRNDKQMSFLYNKILQAADELSIHIFNEKLDFKTLIEKLFLKKTNIDDISLISNDDSMKIELQNMNNNSKTDYDFDEISGSGYSDKAAKLILTRR